MFKYYYPRLGSRRDQISFLLLFYSLSIFKRKTHIKVKFSIITNNGILMFLCFWCYANLFLWTLESRYRLMFTGIFIFSVFGFMQVFPFVIDSVRTLHSPEFSLILYRALKKQTNLYDTRWSVHIQGTNTIYKLKQTYNLFLCKLFVLQLHMYV